MKLKKRWRHTLGATVGSVIAGLLMASCDLVTTPGATVVGIIAWDGAREGGLDTQVIEAPDTVEVGVPFDVIVSTIADCPEWSAAGTNVESNDSMAVIVPYDRSPEGSDWNCPGEFVNLPRPVELRFTEPGIATVRVDGRWILADGTAGLTYRMKEIVVRAAPLARSY